MSRKNMASSRGKDKKKASEARKAAAAARAKAAKVSDFNKKFKQEYGQTPEAAARNINIALDDKEKDLKAKYEKRESALQIWAEKASEELKQREEKIERREAKAKDFDLHLIEKERLSKEETLKREAHLKAKNTAALNMIAAERADLEAEIEKRMEPLREEVEKIRLSLVEDAMVSSEIRDSLLNQSEALAKSNAELDARTLDVVRREKYINDTFLNETDKSRSRRLRERGLEITELKRKNKQLYSIGRSLMEKNEELRRLIASKHSSTKNGNQVLSEPSGEAQQQDQV